MELTVASSSVAVQPVACTAAACVRARVVVAHLSTVIGAGAGTLVNICTGDSGNQDAGLGFIPLGPLYRWLPWHVRPLMSRYPELQKQVKEPAVFLQPPLLRSQLSLLKAHSLISAVVTNIISINERTL